MIVALEQIKKASIIEIIKSAFFLILALSLLRCIVYFTIFLVVAFKYLGIYSTVCIDNYQKHIEALPKSNLVPCTMHDIILNDDINGINVFKTAIKSVLKDLNLYIDLLQVKYINYKYVPVMKPCIQHKMKGTIELVSDTMFGNIMPMSRLKQAPVGKKEFKVSQDNVLKRGIDIVELNGLYLLSRQGNNKSLQTYSKDINNADISLYDIKSYNELAKIIIYIVLNVTEFSSI